MMGSFLKRKKENCTAQASNGPFSYFCPAHCELLLCLLVVEENTEHVFVSFKIKSAKILIIVELVRVIYNR